MSDNPPMTEEQLQEAQQFAERPNCSGAAYGWITALIREIRRLKDEAQATPREEDLILQRDAYKGGNTELQAQVTVLRQLLEQAQTGFGKGSWATWEENVRKALSKHPMTDEATWILGQCSRENERLKAELEQAQQRLAWMDAHAVAFVDDNPNVDGVCGVRDIQADVRRAKQSLGSMQRRAEAAESHVAKLQAENAELRGKIEASCTSPVEG